MAKHRMVSTEIIFTDKFLRLSHSQIALYFGIMLLADDDGIYEAPEDLMHRIRVTEVDLKQLFDYGFILCSSDGAVAVAHWLWHNRIREGRYTPSHSAFVNELGVHDNGIYDYLANMNEGEPSLASLIEVHNAYRQSLGKTNAEPIRRTKLKDVKRMALSLPPGENVNFESDKNILVDQWYTSENVKDEVNKNVLVYLGKEREGKVSIEKESVHAQNVKDEVNIKKQVFSDEYAPSSDWLYGECKNVFLKPEEYKKIYDTYVEPGKLINKVSYILMTVNSKASKNHFAYINKIAIEDGWKRKADVNASQQRREANIKVVEESCMADEQQANSLRTEEDIKERRKEMIRRMREVSPYTAERLIEAYEREYEESFEDE